MLEVTPSSLLHTLSCFINKSRQFGGSYPQGVVANTQYGGPSSLAQQLVRIMTQWRPRSNSERGRGRLFDKQLLAIGSIQRAHSRAFRLREVCVIQPRAPPRHFELC